MKYDSYTLPNGIRLIHKFVPSLVSHCGLLINTGSRDENDQEHGMAHFIEHVFFKGTKKRKTFHILSRLEDVGGQINAYTTKEETCIYAAFLSDYYNRSVELISDIIFNSTFPAKEINKEKEVIIDEINSYKDIPGEMIFDDFEEMVFKNNPLGRNILGTSEKLKSFTKQNIENFIQNNYHTDEMVICSVGNIIFPKLLKLVQKYFEKIPASYRVSQRKKISNYSPNQKTIKKNAHQAHCIIGNIAYDHKDDRRIGLALLNNLMGGPGLNSRLNLSLREKNGFAYNIESNYSPYSDTGLFNIYFSTDKNNLNRSLNIIQKELKLIKSKKLGKLQLQKAKRQITGQLAISSENNENMMLAMAKSHLIYNKFDSIEKISKKIEKITSEQILEIANDILVTDKLSSLIFE